MSVRGKIAKWNDEKGFGFITPSSGGNQVFVHIKALPRGVKRPEIGADVTYETVIDAQGRSRAENVKLIGGQFSLGPAVTALMTGGAFLAIVAALAVHGRLPLFVLWLYLGMSALSLGMYALDKSAARKGGQRTPENTLHLLSLGGGWPGAMYAQQLLRHKSSKTSFRIVFWLTVAINIAALIYLLSSYGYPHLAKLQARMPTISTIWAPENEAHAVVEQEVEIYLCQNGSGEKFAQATPCPAGSTLLKGQYSHIK